MIETVTKMKPLHLPPFPKVSVYRFIYDTIQHRLYVHDVEHDNFPAKSFFNLQL